MHARKTDPISRIYDAPEKALPSFLRSLFLPLSSTSILWTAIIWMDATAPYSRNPVSFLLPHIRAFRYDYASLHGLFRSVSVNLYFLAWETVYEKRELRKSHRHFMYILYAMIFSQRSKSEVQLNKCKKLVLLSVHDKKWLILNNSQLVAYYICYIKTSI